MSAARILMMPLASGLLLAGCASGPRYDVSVYVSPELARAYGGWPTLEVDLVGVNADEATRLSGYDIDAYFEPGNPLRASLSAVRMKFSSSKVLQAQIADDDAHWKQWRDKGAESLLIVVNLPRTSGQGEAAQDPRRVLVPLSSGHWYGRDTGEFHFEISPVGIVRLPQAPQMESLLPQPQEGAAARDGEETNSQNEDKDTP